MKYSAVFLSAYALSAGYYDAYYRKAQQVRRLIKEDYDLAFKDIASLQVYCTERCL